MNYACRLASKRLYRSLISRGCRVFKGAARDAFRPAGWKDLATVAGQVVRIQESVFRIKTFFNQGMIRPVRIILNPEY
jgi:hypothetical protein